ncbi:MAG: hypothetical protein ABR561_07370, partial [Guyparkeria sp.]
PLTGGAIAGTRRAWWIEALDARITPCAPGRLALAEAAFLCNAVSAWRPVGRLLGRALVDTDTLVPPIEEVEAVEGCWQPPAVVTTPWPEDLSEALAGSCWGRVARREFGAEAGATTSSSRQTIRR